MTNDDWAVAATHCDGHDLIVQERRGEAEHQHDGHRHSSQKTQTPRRLDCRDQHRSTDLCGDREGDATHIGRTLEARHHDQDQRQ